jgi:hypothetical protein
MWPFSIRMYLLAYNNKKLFSYFSRDVFEKRMVFLRGLFDLEHSLFNGENLFFFANDHLLFLLQVRIDEPLHNDFIKPFDGLAEYLRLGQL